MDEPTYRKPTGMAILRSAVLLHAASTAMLLTIYFGAVFCCSIA
jgi:hypothetical protein